MRGAPAPHVRPRVDQANLRHTLHLLRHGTAAVLEEHAPIGQRLDILHIVYRPTSELIPNSDAEFSRISIAERRAAGYTAMKAALDTRPWERVLPTHATALLHRHDGLSAETLPFDQPGAPAPQPHAS